MRVSHSYNPVAAQRAAHQLLVGTRLVGVRILASGDIEVYHTHRDMAVGCQLLSRLSPLEAPHGLPPLVGVASWFKRELGVDVEWVRGKPDTRLENGDIP